MIILSVVKIKRITLFLLIFILLFSRSQGLLWGLPHPFHPDERNMVMAIQQLECDPANMNDCFNPRFFAYGQLPLYAAYGFVQVFKFFDGDLYTAISYSEGAYALRLISALSSLVLAYFVVRIISLLRKGKDSLLVWTITLLAVTFSPALIQFAHFGTTESLLMLFYTWLIYESLLLMNKKIPLRRFLLVSALVSGLAIATKVSALTFLAIPALALFYERGKNLPLFINSLFAYGLLTVLLGIIFSPHNLLSFDEFLSSLSYESAVALGQTKVFYTRQFENTIPVLFQFVKVFPYVLGVPALLLFVAGFFTLKFNKQNNFLRLAFLIYFLPNAFFFAKWTRFMAPVLPLMIIFAVLAIFFLADKLKERMRKESMVRLLISFTALIVIIPGFAYMSIYLRPDVRQSASLWIVENIPPETLILSETANVVDIPLDNLHEYNYVSFNFYELDQDMQLQAELEEYLDQAEYIFVPSRRLFANHPEQDYPKLNEYHRKLFNGELGFAKVAEFTSYPKISFLGKTLLEFPDEGAEETWTVFDHPVIRIYKRQ